MYTSPRTTAALLLALVLAPQAAEAQPAHRIALHAPIPMASGSFGRAIEGLGDVDGDGRGDFCVWDPGTNRVHVYSGATLQLLHSIDVAVIGEVHSLTGTPDFDGDGRSDLLIGARLYSGADGQLLQTYAPAGLTSPRASTVVPDADGDGHFDVAISQFGAGVTQTTYLVSGATGALLHEISPSKPFIEFGAALTGLQDIGGDGRGDLAIGAPYSEEVYVYSGASGTLIRTHTSGGFLNPTRFGSVLDAFEDVDGDGFGDLLVGMNRGQDDSGRVYVYSGATGEELFFVENRGAEWDLFGSAAAVIPDLTGDGTEDFVVGAPNYSTILNQWSAVHLFDGAGVRLAVLPAPNEAYIGHTVAGVPDLDGDGLGEFLVGSDFENVAGLSGAGLVYLCLSAAPPPPDVAVAPVDPPIFIPVEGGSFSFTVALTSQGIGPQQWYVWGQAKRDGAPVGSVLGPMPIVLAPGQDTTATFVQEVPAAAPEGDYTYTVSIGRYPNPMVGAFSFPFTKAQGTTTEPTPGSAGLALAVAPNPTSDRATLTLTLPAPGPARLSLHDALGREVGALLDGPLAAGAHGVPLDASRLAPGVYVARLEAGGSVVTHRIVVAR